MTITTFTTITALMFAMISLVAVHFEGKLEK